MHVWMDGCMYEEEDTCMYAEEDTCMHEEEDTCMYGWMDVHVYMALTLYSSFKFSLSRFMVYFC